MSSKACNLCLVTKPLTSFYRHGAGTRTQARCKQCNNAKSREWAKNNREKANALTREWIKKNPHYHRRKWLSRYGITPEQYDELLASQGGVCAICKDAGKMHVDHDHATGAVRGLLCSNCNLGIGNLKESATIMTAAIAYLSVN